MRYSIRPAEASDLASVSALLTASHLAPNALEAQFGPQFAVAVDDDTGALVGVTGIERYGDYGLLRSAAVHEAWRGRRVGEALTRERLAWAEGQGLARVFLLTETAATYWPRFGFTVTSREGAPEALRASHEWRQGCPASAVAMCLDLPRTAATA